MSAQTPPAPTARDTAPKMPAPAIGVTNRQDPAPQALTVPASAAGNPSGSNAPGFQPSLRNRPRPAYAGTNAPAVPNPLTAPAAPGAKPMTPAAGAPAPGAPAPETLGPGDAAVAAMAATNQMIAIKPPPAATNAPPEEMILPGVIKFQAVDINQVLQVYAELVNRTVLRPTALPAATITLTTQTPLTRREAIAAFDSVLGLNGITMINIADKFVKAVPFAQANTEGAAFSQQGTTNMADLGPYVTHVVQLKYSKPTEVVPALQIFAKLPNSIFAIDSSQILVLRDYTENVKRMLEMIEKVDVVVPSEFVSRVIPIKYALASEIASALNSLSTGGGGATVGKSTSGGGSRGGFGGGVGGMGGPGAGGFGTGYSPGGTQPGMTQPGMTSPGAGRTTGGSFTDRLQSIIRKASVSGEIQILGQTKIVADERTNSLLIYASKEDMKTIEDIVSKLDVVLPQVLIETVIIEVTLGPNNKQYGLAYLQHPKSVGQWTGVGAVGRPFYSPNDFITPSSGTNALGNLIGGFNYLMSFNQDLDLTLQAVESDTRAKILQRPRIQTSHNEKAQIFIGQSRPYPTGSYYGGGAYGSYSSIQQLQIGVELDVTPLINTEGLVVMDIHQKIDSFQGNVTIQGVGDVPITSSKEAAAKVAVRDHDTIMLGGLIETDKSKSASGVPFLMDIPLLGYLFKSANSSETRSELIVLIRPTVLPTPQVAALAADAETDKMPGVRREKVEMQAEEAAHVQQSRKAAKKEQSKPAMTP